MQYLSMSQLAEICRLDRRTVKQHLAGLNPEKIQNNAHLYYAPIAIPILLQRAGRTNPNWTEIITRLLNQRDLVPNPLSKLCKENSNVENS